MSYRPFILCLTLLFLPFTGPTGCQLFRPYGSKQKIEPPDETPHRKVDSAVRTMRFEVITDASGQVVTIIVRKSSGLESIDAYVADSLRQSYTPGPSQRALIELTYSAARDKRFSDPKLISSSPAS